MVLVAASLIFFFPLKLKSTRPLRTGTSIGKSEQDSQTEPFIPIVPVSGSPETVKINIGTLETPQTPQICQKGGPACVIGGPPPCRSSWGRELGPETPSNPPISDPRRRCAARDAGVQQPDGDEMPRRVCVCPFSKNTQLRADCWGLVGVKKA